MTVTVSSAAIRLNLSHQRVYAMIGSGRLRARRDQGQWTIDVADINALGERKRGRPRRIYLD